MGSLRLSLSGNPVNYLTLFQPTRWEGSNDRTERALQLSKAQCGTSGAKTKSRRAKASVERKKKSEVEILLKAVRTHFSTEEFTASRDRATVRIERGATGNVAFVRMLDDGRFGVTTQDDLTIKLRGGEELTMDKELRTGYDGLGPGLVRGLTGFTSCHSQ